MRNSYLLAIALIALLLPHGQAVAQAATIHQIDLASAVAEARANNPEIQAAALRAEAAAARVPQAGAPPDPMLTAGTMYLPVPSFDPTADGMTMFSVGLGQRFLAPGVLRARRDVAEALHAAARLDVAEVENRVLARVKAAYFDLLFVERSLEVLADNRGLLSDFSDVATARLAVGRAPQVDVLRAHTEVSRLDEQLAGLEARRVAARSELNALLGRDPALPVVPRFPDDVQRLALTGGHEGSFVSAHLTDHGAAGLPPREELRERAVRERPMLLAHVRRIEAADADLRRAERARLPDVDVMVEWGGRSARRDMVSAMASVPLPVFAGRKQRQEVREAEADLSALRAEHHGHVYEIEAAVEARYEEVVRVRERIRLLADGVIPQADATVESALAAYQAGRVEFLTLLEAQAALFRHEIDLERQMADFGRALARLEEAVGAPLMFDADPDADAFVLPHDR